MKEGGLWKVEGILLVKTGKRLSDTKGIWTHNHLVLKRTLNHLAKLVKWLSYVVNTYIYGAFDIKLFHVMYVFHSESSLCICLNVKELLIWKRRNTWSLSDNNGVRIRNYLVRKQTLNHLAKLV